MVVELWDTFPKFDLDKYFSYFVRISPFIFEFTTFSVLKKGLIVEVSLALNFFAKNMVFKFQTCKRSHILD
jgi:hypothetical protein